jgi:formamidopyrimidine-DNA glycosylase
MVRGKTIRNVEIRRQRVIAPTSPQKLKSSLRLAEFIELTRRGKYLLFSLQHPKKRDLLRLVGHLGMTGRMYLLPARHALPKHAAVVLNLGDENFVFEDTRYFGRFTLDPTAIDRLGPEPLENEFSVQYLAQGLSKSSQPIKVKLLDQSLVAGVGNIYASEALFRARISPKVAARRLKCQHIERLWQSIRTVLTEAIECGSTVRLDYSGTGPRDRLFYFGSADTSANYEERLRVYDREGQPCLACGTPVRRIVQAARSTFYCPDCQR